MTSGKKHVLFSTLPYPGKFKLNWKDLARAPKQIVHYGLRPLMHRMLPTSWTNLLCALGLMACQPKIGDECVTDIDCSQQGDRICDTTQPNGYCTQVDCDPKSCPEKESICIAFNHSISDVGACHTRGATSPYRRTFCMESCKDDGDCRKGYDCVDMTEDNPWGAEVIQDDPKRNTVCMLAMSFDELDAQGEDQVCTGAPASSAGGAGGAGGSQP